MRTVFFLPTDDENVLALYSELGSMGKNRKGTGYEQYNVVFATPDEIVANYTKDSLIIGFSPADGDEMPRTLVEISKRISGEREDFDVVKPVRILTISKFEGRSNVSAECFHSEFAPLISERKTIAILETLSVIRAEAQEAYVSHLLYDLNEAESIDYFYNVAMAIGDLVCRNVYDSRVASIPIPAGLDRRGKVNADSLA